MSRTDVHRPWRVQAVDPYNRALIRCYSYWNGEPQYVESTDRRLSCGCRMCTGYYWHHREVRSRRVQWRSAARVILKTVTVDREDIDPEVWR